MSSELLLISIGPVQDFIASARRGRDLWFGSWFLSEVAKAAARSLRTSESRAIFIFPSIPEKEEELKPGSSFNCVNKLLVKLPSGTAQGKMQAVQKAVQCRVKALWKKISEDPKVARPLLFENAKKQLDDLVELLWVALPLPDEGQYVRVRSQLEHLMHIRKQTRAFQPVSWGATAPKCALDGERESVIPEEAYRRQPNESDATRSQRLYTRFGISDGERLSAVGLLKRLGRPDHWKDETDEQHRVPSASHIAATPLMQRMTDVLGEKPSKIKVLDEYIACLEKDAIAVDLITPFKKGSTFFGGYQGRILYETRLPELLGLSKKESSAQNTSRASSAAGSSAADQSEAKKVTDAQKALRNLLNELAGGRQPSPYYALLMADGDRMGATVDALKTVEQHQTLSRNLSKFAAQVRSLIDDQELANGRLVYAGGDDVMAFVPLHTLLGTLEALRELFHTRMKEALEACGTSLEPPTLSFGVVIAHHMEPVGYVRERVREAEQRAKQLPGKDALAITLCKRGGADITVCHDTPSLLSRLHWMTELYQQDALSSKAAYELQDAALRHQATTPQREGKQDLASRALAYDALRILSRKRSKRGSLPLAGDDRDRLKGLLVRPEYVLDGEQPTDTSGQHLLPRTGEPLKVEELALELIVAKMFAEACDQADDEQPQRPKDWLNFEALLRTASPSTTPSCDEVSS